MAATAHFLSASITKMILSANGNEIGSGTGFFVKRDNQWFLVSNWHVFSGRNRQTGQPIHSSCAIPDHCFVFTKRLDTSGLKIVKHRIALLDNDSVPLWFEHSDHGRSVDIAVLKVHADVAGCAKDILSPSGERNDMFVDLGGELFIPGYPQGFSANGEFPIWKRASLATSEEFDTNTLNPLLIDTASRSGMSGALCVAICNRDYYRKVGAGPKMEMVHLPISWKLLGVYSGRLLAKDELDTQLGQVWRKPLLIEILEQGKRVSP